MEHERRVYQSEVRAIESENGHKVIAGISPMFNVTSDDLGGFREIIKPGALDGILGSADVRGRFDHDLILGRNTAGTMRLELRGDGLHYEIDINEDDPAALGAYARVRRGDVDGSSFMFDVDENGDNWVRQSDGTYLRTISQFAGLYDVGPVAFPAYPQTNAYTRSKLSELQQQEKQAAEAGKPDVKDNASQVRRNINKRKLEILKLKGVRND